MQTCEIKSGVCRRDADSVVFRHNARYAACWACAAAVSAQDKNDAGRGLDGTLRIVERKPVHSNYITLAEVDDD